MSNDRGEDDRTRNNRKGKYFFFLVSSVLFSAFAYQLYYHAIETSATVDEPFHILAGHRHWQCGDFGINPEHPPLLKLLAAAPLNFRELSEPPWDCGSKLTPKFDGFSYGSTFLVDNGVDGVLIQTRLASSLMAMLLALLVFVAAWEMFGWWEALTALLIVAFEPNLIARGSMVMTDMALSATAFAAVYALYRFGKEPSRLRFFVTGLAFGLMLAAKHSAVIFIAILYVLVIAEALLFRKPETRVVQSILRRSAAFAGMFLTGLMVLWSFYGFNYRAVPNETAATIAVAEYIKENGRPESIGSFPARVTEAISDTHLFPESYVLGMADVIAWGSRNTVIFGRNYPNGKWFYFPVAFVVKTSLALLFLLPLGLIFLLFNREKRLEGMYLIVPAMVFFVVAANSNFTTGVRHILPVYGFLIILASAGAIWTIRKFTVFRYVLVASLVFSASATVRTAPYYLAFSNDIWGGYENTYRVLTGSDNDTGQSIKFVNEFLARENIGGCWIAAWVHPEMILSVQPCRPMPAGLRIMVSRNATDPVPPVIEGTVILSANELPPRGGDEYVPIAQSEPIAVIGGNMFVYRGRFEIPLAAAISRVQRSNHFLRVGDVDQALSEGRQAVELAPNDPRPHLALGLALARAGHADDARSELEKTVSFAKEDSRFRNAEVRALRELERLQNK